MILEKKEKQLLQLSVAQKFTDYKIPESGKMAITIGEK